MTNNRYPTPNSTVTKIQPKAKRPNSGIHPVVPAPNPNVDAKPENSGFFHYPGSQDTAKTVVQTNYPQPPQTKSKRNQATTLQQTAVKNPAKPKNKLNISDPKLSLLPFAGVVIVSFMIIPVFGNLFPYPRVLLQKTFGIASNECKLDSGELITGNALILTQDGKTNVLYSCRDSILNGTENGVKRGMNDDGKSFALPVGNYRLQKAKKFLPTDDFNHAVQLPFAYEFAAQETGKDKVINDLSQLPADWTQTHKITSVGMIYPINSTSKDIKGNEVNLEIGVKPDSTIFKLHQKGYLDGTVLVVKQAKT